MQEGGSREVAITYTVPSRADEDGEEEGDQDPEDLPDLMPIRDGVAPSAS